MNFLKSLFGFASDPTRDWPSLSPAAPTLDLRTMAVGPLRFGSPLAEARTFGKPDVFHRTAIDYLFYARAGFGLDYEDDRLVFLTYFLTSDTDHVTHPAFVPSQPTITLHDGSVRQLTANSDAEALVAVFGQPESAELDPEESVLEWKCGECTIEAGLSPQARLYRLNVFLTHS